MNIEEEIFKKCTLNETNLIKYGFIKEKKWYKYKTSLDSFSVEITIINNKVKGKIYDLESESEYTNYRVKDIQGSFALDIKEKYIKILKDIKDKCFDKNYFMYSQSNRITNLIIKKYKIAPKFLWEKSPGYGVFKGVNDKGGNNKRSPVIQKPDFFYFIWLFLDQRFLRHLLLEKLVNIRRN